MKSKPVCSLQFVFRLFKQKTGNAIRALGRMAILSANSRKNLSAGSSPTKTEFGDELFADVTTDPHGFKPIQPVVLVDDRTAEDYEEKPEEIVEDFVKPFVVVKDRTGDNCQEKLDETVEELVKKSFAEIEDKTGDNFQENLEEIVEELVKNPFVDVEDKTGDNFQEKLEEIVEDIVKNPFVEVEDEIGDNNQEKLEEVVEELVKKPFVEVENKTGENCNKKLAEIVEELVKPFVEVEDRTGENNEEKAEEIVEEVVERIVEFEVRTEENCQEEPEETIENLSKPMFDFDDRTRENNQKEPEEIVEELVTKKIIKIKDIITEENYQEEPEEIAEEEEKSYETEVDKFTSISRDNFNPENYKNDLLIKENCPTVTEIENTIIDEQDELQHSKPLIQEIDDLILIEKNKKSINSATEVSIEELSNEICADTEISTDFESETTGSSNFEATTRKLSFSSFVNLEITETGEIEVYQSSEPEECLKIEESDESIDYERNKEDDAEEKKNNETNSVCKEEILDTHDNDDGQQVIEKTPVVTKVWCKNNNPVSLDEEDEDARLMGRVRTRHIVCTGSVSRTAKMFEKEEEANSPSQKQQNPVNRLTPISTETRPQNERIRKAFAFWNK